MPDEPIKQWWVRQGAEGAVHFPQKLNVSFGTPVTPPPVHTCEPPPPETPITRFNHGPNARYEFRYQGRVASSDWFSAKRVCVFSWSMHDRGDSVMERISIGVSGDEQLDKHRIYREADACIANYLERLNYEEGQARAHARAMDLLHSHLTEAQRVELDENGTFVVVAPDGAKWELGPDLGEGVYRHADTGYAWCAYAVGCPKADTVLMHKLMIEAGEAGKLQRMSCRH